MKSVFVAAILLFNTSNGQLEEAGVITFDTSALCNVFVENLKAKAAADMTVDIEASCVETPIISAQ